MFFFARSADMVTGFPSFIVHFKEKVVAYLYYVVDYFGNIFTN